MLDNIKKIEHRQADHHDDEDGVELSSDAIDTAQYKPRNVAVTRPETHGPPLRQNF